MINDGTVQRTPDGMNRTIGEEIRDIFGILISQRHLVAQTVLAVMMLVILYVWISTPLYSSKVEILIDPRQRQMVESEIMPTGLGSSAAGADTLLLESQVEVLRSQRVTDALIRAENLTADSEFAGSGSFLPIELVKIAVKSVIYGPQPNLWRKTSPYDKAVKTLRKRMDVARERNTYVIGITVRSKYAEKAARLANRIADIYISDVNSAASKMTREAATTLTAKLEELRTTANEAARAVENYRQQKNLIGANETLIVEQQLGDLNRELGQAQAEVQSTLARRNQLKAAIEYDTGTSARLDVGESTVMTQLQTKLAEVESQEADLQSIYLSAHPTLKRLRERKAALKASLRQEYKRILDRLDVAHKTALERTSSLEAEVAKLETKMAASNADRVNLRELEREAQTTQSVYESFLRRSKEAWEQVDIPNSTARIISAAYAASRPSEPNVLMLLASGLAFSLMLGVAFAFLNHVLFGRSVAGPPDAIDPMDAMPNPDPRETPAPVTILQRRY